MGTLRIGEQFPELQARAVDGSTLGIPDGLHGINAVLIFYRGHW
jgi:peroxiredoxin